MMSSSKEVNAECILSELAFLEWTSAEKAGCVCRNFVSGAILVAVVLMLSACSVFPSKEPLAVYVLRPSVIETMMPRCEYTVQIHRPKAGGLLNSSKIVVMPAPQQINVYKGVRWDEVLPQAVRDYLIDTFRSSAVFTAVIGSESRAEADFYLDSTMRSFQSSYVRAAENGGNPVIEVEFAAQLVKAETSIIVAQHNFIVLQPSAGTGVDAVVLAFNSAAANLSAQVLEWTATHIEQLNSEE